MRKSNQPKSKISNACNARAPTSSKQFPFCTFRVFTQDNKTRISKSLSRLDLLLSFFSSLSLMVLARLLPQVTTYDHYFTIVSLHSTLNELTLTICSRSIFTKSLKRLSILVAGLLTRCSFKILQDLPTFGISGAFPFERSTCVQRLKG